MGQLWLEWVGQLWLKQVSNLWLKWVGNLGWSIYDLKGQLWLKWVGQLWQSEILFLGDMLEKHWSSGEYSFRSTAFRAHCSVRDVASLNFC